MLAMLGLIGSLGASILAARDRRWLFAVGYASMATYTLLDKIIKPPFLPPLVIDAFSLVFALCMVIEVVRRRRARMRAPDA